MYGKTGNAAERVGARHWAGKFDATEGARLRGLGGILLLFSAP